MDLCRQTHGSVSTEPRPFSHEKGGIIRSSLEDFHARYIDFYSTEDFFPPPFWATLGYAHRGYQCRRNRSWNTLVYQDPFHRFQPWTINVIAYETDLIDAIRPNENGSACILAISRIWISIVYVWRCTSKLLARCYLES